MSNNKWWNCDKDDAIFSGEVKFLAEEVSNLLHEKLPKERITAETVMKMFYNSLNRKHLNEIIKQNRSDNYTDSCNPNIEIEWVQKRNNQIAISLYAGDSNYLLVTMDAVNMAVAGHDYWFSLGFDQNFNILHSEG